MADSPTLYPYEVPEEAHPYEWVLLGFGLDHESAKELASHIFDKLGCSPPVEEWNTYTVSWAVDRDRYSEGRVAVSVGDTYRLDLRDTPAGDGAVRLTGGALPPGVRLDKSERALVGTFTTPGLYEATVTVGPTVKYDALGGPGGPQYPGMWVDVDAPRAKVETGLDQYNVATVDDLDELAKDELLAKLLAERNSRAAKAEEV